MTSAVAALLAVPLQELEAGQAGHAHVAQDDVGLQLLRARQPLLAIARGLDLVALAAEDQRNGLPESGLVVDDENGHGRKTGGRRVSRPERGHNAAT